MDSGASPPRILVVTSRHYEAAAVVGDREHELHSAGPFVFQTFEAPAGEVSSVVADAGPIAAAAAASALMASEGPFDLVINTGLAAAFPGRGAEVGDLVVGTDVHYADVGTGLTEGFADQSTLHWSSGIDRCPGELVDEIAERLDAIGGPILTVVLPTTTMVRAAELSRQYPDAVAEAQEGAGVAWCADKFSVFMTELRAVGSLIGPRDQFHWDKPVALEVMTTGFARLWERPLAALTRPR